ncbi:GAF domain-containing protein [Streptomyces sp. HUAS TT7]|uniref:GAF domain-containing protein n=1 Tax=Streptomyces sp. HUAS TT7 TaxID=3447507 RepID=UPI003F65DDC2
MRKQDGTAWSRLAPTARIAITKHPDHAAMLRVAGELDEACLPALAQALLRLENTPGKVALDLSRVTFCAPAVLDHLVSAAHQLGAAGSELVIERAHSQVLNTLRLCGPPAGLRIAPAPMGLLTPDEHQRRDSLVRATLALALRITSAPMGNAQLLDPAAGVLRIVAQRGFRDPFLSFFETVDDRDTACGIAAQDRQPIFVDEVATSPIFLDTPALDVLQDADVGAVVSLPITTRDTTLIGVVSTHRPHPAAWTREQQNTLTRLARAASQTL